MKIRRCLSQGMGRLHRSTDTGSGTTDQGGTTDYVDATDPGGTADYVDATDPDRQERL